MIFVLTAVTMSQSVTHLVLDTVTVYADKVKSPLQHMNEDALNFISEYADNKHILEWYSDIPDLQLTYEQKAELREFVQKDILAGKQLTDMEKTRAIFNWITKHVHYARGGEIPALNPYEVFQRKVAVCGGYSNLYKALLNAADIPSLVVFGTIPRNITSKNGQTLDPAHQWNAVYADGKWFYSDSTWGGSYFNKSVEAISKDHQLNKVQDVYYVEKGIVYGFSQGGLSVENFDDKAERVEIPDESNGRPVVALATSARIGKSSLKTIVLGRNVTRFESAAFELEHLEKIEVAVGNEQFESRDGVLFKKGLSEIVYYPNNKKSETFIIPKETVTYDAKQTFQNESLKALLVEEGNPNFTSYEGVLYNKNMTEILTVPKAATKVIIAGTAHLNNYALSFNPTIEEVIIEEGITEIPAGVFNETSNLRRVTLPKTLTMIDEQAFGALNLANITIIGEADTVADQFAKKHHVSFTVLPMDVEKDKSKEVVESSNDTNIQSEKPKDYVEVPSNAPIQEEKVKVYLEVKVPDNAPVELEKPKIYAEVPSNAPVQEEVKAHLEVKVPNNVPVELEKPKVYAEVPSTAPIQEEVKINIEVRVPDNAPVELEKPKAYEITNKEKSEE